MARVPHFRQPFSVVDGVMAVVEQDSEADIAQCTHAVLSTPVGSRIEVPDFGRPTRLFEQLGDEASPDAYLAAVEIWEPRAHALGDAAVKDMVERIVVRPGVHGV